MIDVLRKFNDGDPVNASATVSRKGSSAKEIILRHFLSMSYANKWIMDLW
jgi:hypothetical protein